MIGTMPKDGLLYNWSPTTNLSNPTIANPLAAPSITTDYIVTTTNSGGGCRTTDTVHIVASVIDSSLQFFGKEAYCFEHGDSAVFQVKPIKNIEWVKDNIPITTSANQIKYKATKPGTYYAVLTNEDGCKIATSKKTIAIDFDKPGITYPIKFAIDNIPLVLTARLIGTTALWNPSLNLNNPKIFEPSFKSSREQLYNIVITSAAGCITIDTQMVKIIKGVEIYVPTAFTPNSDGKNDNLYPICRGVGEIRAFRVFNRLGQLLYEAKTELPGWDGNYRGLQQAPQTFVWMLECVGLDGVVYYKKGSTVLVR
jgi:gliding motility-associated-like protein